MNDPGSTGQEIKDAGRRALAIRDHLFRFQNAIGAVERCRHPVIAAIHGIAFGLGIDIASACDIRFAASDAVFSIKVCSPSPFRYNSNNS